MTAPILWNIAAPFFSPQARDDEPVTGRWIDDFCNTDRHRFRKIGARPAFSDDWHIRASRSPAVSRWLAMWEHAGRALRGADGLITVFPQLAAIASARQLLSARPVPHVAWCYNIGALPTGLNKILVRRAASRVSRFVVHASAEAPLISEYLNVPRDRVVFHPLQASQFEADAPPDEAEPFIVSLGSAHRDYETLLQALAIEKIPTVIVAARRVMEGLVLPPHVKHLHGLTSEECYRLIQRARFCVVPLHPTVTAAGQVTVIDALRSARAVVTTEVVGTVDYVQDGVTGFLVPPRQPEALAAAMGRLWRNPELAGQFGAEGLRFARRELSDPVAARNLLSVLDEVAGMSQFAGTAHP